MKVSNKSLSRFFNLGLKIKELEEERKQIREEIVKTGSCSTKDYIATVEPRISERLCGVKEMEKFVSRDQLLKWDVLSISHSTHVVVKPKGREV